MGSASCPVDYVQRVSAKFWNVFPSSAERDKDEDRPPYHLMGDILRAGWAEVQATGDSEALFRAAAKALMVEHIVETYNSDCANQYVRKWEEYQDAHRGSGGNHMDFVLDFNQNLMTSVQANVARAKSKREKETKKATASKNAGGGSVAPAQGKTACSVCGKASHTSLDRCWTLHPELAPEAQRHVFQAQHDRWVADSTAALAAAGVKTPSEKPM
jgi:hypothetical protein